MTDEPDIVVVLADMLDSEGQVYPLRRLELSDHEVRAFELTTRRDLHATDCSLDDDRDVPHLRADHRV